MTNKGMMPVCPICGKPLLRGSDLHEAVFTRRNVQGASKEAQEAIYVPENCVLVHPGKCHEFAQTRPGRMLCYQELIREEGLAKVLKFVDRMDQLLVVSYAQLEKGCIMQVAERMRECTG